MELVVLLILVMIFWRNPKEKNTSNDFEEYLKYEFFNKLNKK